MSECYLVRLITLRLPTVTKLDSCRNQLQGLLGRCWQWAGEKSSPICCLPCGYFHMLISEEEVGLRWDFIIHISEDGYEVSHVILRLCWRPCGGELSSASVNRSSQDFRCRVPNRSHYIHVQNIIKSRVILKSNLTKWLILDARFIFPLVLDNRRQGR